MPSSEDGAKHSRPPQSLSGQGDGTAAKICRRALIVLIYLLAAGVLLTGALIIYIQKVRLPQQVEDIGVIERVMDRAIDGMTISIAIREFRLFNDGEFPSVQEIVAIVDSSPSSLLLYGEETMEIRGLGHDTPDKAKLPVATNTFHIWPGYVCAVNQGVFSKYSHNPLVASYAEIVMPGDARDFAVVFQTETVSYVQEDFTLRCGGSYAE